MNKYQKAIHQLCNRGKEKRGIYKILKKIYVGMARDCELDLGGLVEYKNFKRQYVTKDRK